MSFNFKCPVCDLPLVKDGRTLKCDKNHSFDIAKQGYVNLLRSQKSSKKRHGDDTLMVKARQSFLEKGYYKCLCDAVVEMLLRFQRPEMTVADLGCGECWYTERVYASLEAARINAEVCGVDISKQALILGAKRCDKLHLAVASTFELPLADSSCDVVISIFAPCSASEIHRVLKNDGVWIKAFPLERHLMGLKSVIYDEPYENKVDRRAPSGFVVSDREEISETIEITDREDIIDLFKMTPYYYKTGSADQSKAFVQDKLKTEIQFGIYAYLKV